MTLNWESLDLKPERPGLFYTDANAYKLVKRNISAPHPYPWTEQANKIKQVSSYFYPVNSGLFIEDAEGAGQMVVMNDRPQGGSAYQSGRIELMLHRCGTSSDQLGVWEGIVDPSADGKGVNVSAKFYLAFTETRDQALRLMQRKHLDTMSEVQHFFSRAYSMGLPTGTQSLAARKVITETFTQYIAKNDI